MGSRVPDEPGPQPVAHGPPHRTGVKQSHVRIQLVLFAASRDLLGWDVRLTYGSSGDRVLFEVLVDRWLLAGTAQ